MYHVVYMKDESVMVYLYRSHVESLCWKFIYDRLVHSNENVRANAMFLYVIDAEEKFCDPIAEVKALQNYTKLQYEMQQDVA